MSFLSQQDQEQDVHDDQVQANPVQDNPVQDDPVQDNPVQDDPVQDNLVQDNPVQEQLQQQVEEDDEAGDAEAMAQYEAEMRSKFGGVVSYFFHFIIRNLWSGE